MAIHSFLQANPGDPEWQFTPEEYFDKQFKIIDASLIELDAGAEDNVVLRQSPTEKEPLAKHLKIHVKENSSLDMMIINEMDASIQQIYLYDIYVKPGGRISLGFFAKDGRFNKHIVQVFLEDTAEFAGYGLITNEVGGDTELITKIIHQGADSNSSQLFLGLAGENSQTVFQGIGVVQPEAIQSDISLESANLVTGTNGRCYAKPETYINAEYAVSSHGAIIDTLRPELEGYLQSRGISEEVAREIIISGFRNQVIDIIPDESFQDEIRSLFS